MFPQGLSGLLFGGFKGEVWIQPGEAPSQGALYRNKAAGQPPKPEGAISLVLGEGWGRGRVGGRGGQGVLYRDKAAVQPSNIAGARWECAGGGGAGPVAVRCIVTITIAILLPPHPQVRAIKSQWY